MADLNQVSITGRLGADPELRQTGGGTSVASLRVAVNGRKDDEVSWLDVTVWDKTAENVAKYLAKGSRVAIAGRLVQESWEKDGQTRYAVKIVAFDVVFLDTKADSPKASGSKPATAPAQSQPADDDDIPF